MDQVHALADEYRSANSSCKMFSLPGADQCGPSSGDLYLADWLDSAAGPLVGGWALGLDDPVMNYGPDTTLVQVMRDEPEWQDARRKIIESLQAGGDGDLEDYVDYGEVTDNSNYRMWRDAVNFVAPSLVPDRNLVLQSIGSYEIYGFTIANDKKSRTATIAYIGINPMHLGSLTAYSNDWREAGDQVSQSTGLLSEVVMRFGWTETTHYLGWRV